jgi:quinol monooxygenase YgiN
MAFGITFDIPGMTVEQYKRLVPRLNAMTKGQPGFLVHISGPTETGYRVTEVWESRADQQRFSTEHVARIFQEERIPPATVETFSVENIVTR